MPKALSKPVPDRRALKASHLRRLEALPNRGGASRWRVRALSRVGCADGALVHFATPRRRHARCPKRARPSAPAQRVVLSCHMACTVVTGKAARLACCKSGCLPRRAVGMVRYWMRFLVQHVAAHRFFVALLSILGVKTLSAGPRWLTLAVRLKLTTLCERNVAQERR